MLIEYPDTACVFGPATVAKNESEREIHIMIRLRKHPARDCAPTGGATYGATYSIRLSRPIDGRRVVGPGALLDGRDRNAARVVPHPDGSYDVLVPRLTGLSPTDAILVLKTQGFKPVLRGGRRGEIVQQDPPPRHRVPVPGQYTYFHHGVVRITSALTR